MPANYSLLRQGQALDAVGAKLCDCGHPTREHREYGSTWTVKDSAVPVEVVDPRHRPGLFACQADGCGCEVER